MKAFLNFDSDGKLKYDDNHTCIVDEQKVKILLIINEIKEAVDSSSIPFNVKAVNLLNIAQKTIKRKNWISWRIQHKQWSR